VEKRSSVSNSLGYLSEEELREMYASAFEDGSGIGKEHSPGLPSSADEYEYDNRESSVQRRVKQIKTKIFENVPHKYEPRWDAESHEYEDYCEHCGEMPGNGQHKTAGSWPSDHHANEHLLSISRAMDEMAKGVKWHTEQGEPELAEKHRQALYALDNAHELMSKATVEVNDKKAGVVDFINRQRTKGLTEEFQSYETMKNWKQRYAFPYHVSPAENRSKIEQEGLSASEIPHNWGGNQHELVPGELGWVEPGVYMSPTDQDANEWAKQIQMSYAYDEGDEPTEFDLYHVDTEGLPNLTKRKSWGNYKDEIISPNSIPKERIKHIKRFRPDWTEFANSTHLTNTMNDHDENNASHRQSANVAEAASAHANNLSNQIDD